MFLIFIWDVFYEQIDCVHSFMAYLLNHPCVTFLPICIVPNCFGGNLFSHYCQVSYPDVLEQSVVIIVIGLPKSAWNESEFFYLVFCFLFQFLHSHLIAWLGIKILHANIFFPSKEEINVCCYLA